MTDPISPGSGTVNTVLGPVSADELGIVAVHEALLSVVPGAELAPEVTIDRAAIFDTLARKLGDFRAQGGKTIVDSTGMFHGRDLRLYEALSRSTGVHIIASTGMGPEKLLGGYFLTPQTNPPTPWPAEKFAELFSQEVTEGMVIPRMERRGSAGLVTTAADRDGMTPTEESLFRGAARTAEHTGIGLSIRHGADAAADLDIVLDEQLPAERVLVAGLDRRDAVKSGAAFEAARRGAFIGLDHVGLSDDDDHVDDRERAGLVIDLVEAGYGHRILLSSNAIGVARGQPAYELPYGYVASTFLPLAKSLGLGEQDARRILVDNPRDLLTLS